MKFTELQATLKAVIGDLQEYLADMDDTLADVSRATSATSLLQAISTLDHNDNLNVDGLIIRDLFTRLLAGRSEEERNLLSLASTAMRRYADECHESESAEAELTDDGYTIADLNAAISLIERIADE